MFAFVEDWSLFATVMVALSVAIANVALRKLTNDVNLYWSDEVVRKTIFFTTYVGCIAAIRNRSLIRIDALPQLFPFLKKPLTVFSHIGVLVFSGFMIKLGYSLTEMVYYDEYAKTASLQIPEWYFYAVLPIMGVDDVHSHPDHHGRRLVRHQAVRAPYRRRGALMETNYLVIMALLIGCLASTIPVFMALFFTGMVGLVWIAGIDPQIVIEVLYRSMDKFALIVVLFFVLCGNIMTTGSIVSKLIKTANCMVGFLPGGLAMAGILACGFFGAISGSTVATVVAIGGFMIPALLENNYDEKFSVGVMTTAPILGVIIPPSISMILYAMVTNDPLEALFLTGFVPGILIMFFMSLYAYFFCKRRDAVTMPKPSLQDVLATLRESFWALMLPVLIFGGIYSGYFTANEAAVVACFYAFIVELFIHRDLKLRDIKGVVISSAITSSTLLVIVAGASVFGEYLTFEQIPGQIANAVVANIQTPWVFLLSVNILLLIIGMFMDIISATLILTPIFLPLLSRFGIDSMHFGLLMTLNLGIGYCTPPLGVSLYISGAVADRDLIYVSKAVLPFLLIQVAILMLLTFWPDLVLFLPHWVYPS